jgi:hypothetical protein
LILKDLCPSLGATPLSKSPLWNMQVSEIVPAQLTAFRTRLAIDGNTDKSEAGAIVQLIIRTVEQAVIDGEINAPPLLSYIEPVKPMTMGMLRRTFSTMSRPRPAAILFGLEMKLDVEQIITLKWCDAKLLNLTPYARLILDSQPRHIASPYVFWYESKSKPFPLFGLGEEVLYAFEMTWSELVASTHNRIVAIDEDILYDEWKQLFVASQK